MSSLRDEVYEGLDYLSQLAEVVVSPQIDVLAELPDRLEISLEQLKAAAVASWVGSAKFTVSAVTILTNLVEPDKKHLIEELAKNFILEMSEEFEVDFNKNTMTGSLVLIKQNSILDEKVLLNNAVHNSIRNFGRFPWVKKGLRDRACVVLNTLEENSGTEWFATASTAGGNYAIAEKIGDALRSVILENKWRVRDATVIANMGTWIHDYLSDTNSVGLVNLIKLKMMIDKDLPIYSMEEVKEVVDVKPDAT